MTYSTSNLKKDLGNIPIPQVAIPGTETYEPHTGREVETGRFAADQVIYGKHATGYAPAKMDPDGTIWVKQNGNNFLDFTFQDAITTPLVGNYLDVLGYKTLTVATAGTATSKRIVFEGAGIAGGWVPLMGVNLADMSTATETINVGELWQFDITGLKQVRIRVPIISGGDVTIKGRAVM